MPARAAAPYLTASTNAWAGLKDRAQWLLHKDIPRILPLVTIDRHPEDSRRNKVQGHALAWRRLLDKTITNLQQGGRE